MASILQTYIARSTDWVEVKKELEIKSSLLKEEFLSYEDDVKEDDIELKTKICHIEKDDGKEYYKCYTSYYNLSDYKKLTVDELQEKLAASKEELEEAEEELEEIEDLEKDELGDFDFDSQEEYEERLDDLDDDIYLLKLEIEMIERFLNEKKD